MKTRYIDLVEQAFEFPQEDFSLKQDNLLFHGIDLLELVTKYGSPLKFNYLPKIEENVTKAKIWFKKAFEQNKYRGDYHYCYCTKSNHFSFVVQKALDSGTHLETSSAYDLNIVQHFIDKGSINKDTYVICNGFKTKKYVDGIARLINSGYKNLIPVLDNKTEITELSHQVDAEFQIGIRIASEEEPKHEFYTSRLGIGYFEVIDFYKTILSSHKNVKVKMLHFFINTGINDNAYYWNELQKCLKVFCELKKICPELDSLNIGGGFPIKNKLNFDYDYQYMVEEIIYLIKNSCEEHGVHEPNIFTEFGSFTVGESGAVIFSVLDQKQQNDREKWNMIDGSFMTNLPDTWAIKSRFVLLPINRWSEEYERVMLGGLSCDSDDYYNSETHINAIFLPKFEKDNKLYIGFFNTGAYQDNIGGYGGVHHCLLPQPKHLVIDRNEDNSLKVYQFSPEQQPESMLDLLGY